MRYMMSALFMNGKIDYFFAIYPEAWKAIENRLTDYYNQDPMYKYASFCFLQKICMIATSRRSEY